MVNPGKKMGLEFKIFEYNGLEKKKTFDFHASPGNIEAAKSILDANLFQEMEAKVKKLGNDLKKQRRKVMNR